MYYYYRDEGGNGGNGSDGGPGVTGSVTVLGGGKVTISGGNGGCGGSPGEEYTKINRYYLDPQTVGHGGNGGVGIDGTIDVIDIEATVSGGNAGPGNWMGRRCPDPSILVGSNGRAITGKITALSSAEESDDNKGWHGISGSSSGKRFVRARGKEHVHDFKYAARGNIITATCRNHDGICPLDDGSGKCEAKVGIYATSELYTGSPYAEASVGVSPTRTDAGLAVPKIVYEGREDTSYPRSTTPPTDAGDYSALIVIDKDTIARGDFEINRVALKIIGTSAVDRVYKKDDTAVTINFVRFQDEDGKQWTLKLGKDYTVTGTMADANAGERKDVAAVVTLISGNYTLKKNTATAKVTIRKAAARTLADITDDQCYTLTSVSESVAGAMPGDAGKLTYTAGKASKTGSVKVSDFAVSAKGVASATLSGGKTGDTVTLPVIIGSTNYEDSKVNVVITLTEKENAGVTISGVPAQAVTYCDADFTLKGKVKHAGTGTGVWKWTSSDDTVLGITANGSTATVKILKAGTATITASYESDTTVGTEQTALTVNKADPTIKKVPAGLTASYGQTLSEVPLYNPEGNDPGTWTWMDDTVIGDVGELTYKAEFTPEDSTNYRVVSDIDVKVSVGKAPNPATVIYYVFVKNNGFSVDLEEYIIRNGATGQASFAFVDENDTKGCTLENSYLASGNQMGTVPIKVSIAADDHYEALTEARMLVSVSDKGKQTITAKDVTTTYGATDAKVTATTDGDGAISYSVGSGSDVVDVDANTGALTIKRAGTATVVVTAEETPTYMGATRRVTVTVKKAEAVAATVTANNRGYDGTEKPLVTVSGEPTGGKMQYALGTDATTAPSTGYSTTIPTAVKAGTYYVWYRVKGDANHVDSRPARVKATIKPVNINRCRITVKDQTWTREVLKPIVTVKYDRKKLVKGRDYTLAYSKKIKDVGTYAVKVKGVGNYAGAEKLGFKVNPKGTAFTKVTGGERQITLAWKRQAGVTGYQLQYSLKNDFSAAKNGETKLDSASRMW